MQYSIQSISDLRALNDTKVKLGVNWGSVRRVVETRELSLFDPTLLSRKYGGSMSRNNLLDIAGRTFNPESKVLAPEIDVHAKPSVGLAVRARTLYSALLALSSCPGVKIFSKTNLPSAKVGELQGIILFEGLDLSVETASLVVNLEACGLLPFVRVQGYDIPYSQLTRTQDSFLYCPRVVRSSKKVDHTLDRFKIHSRPIIAIPAAIKNLPGREFSPTQSLDSYYEVVL